MRRPFHCRQRHSGLRRRSVNFSAATPVPGNTSGAPRRSSINPQRTNNSSRDHQRRWNNGVNTVLENNKHSRVKKRPTPHNPGMSLLQQLPPEVTQPRKRTCREHSSFPEEMRRQIKFMLQFRSRAEMSDDDASE